MRTADDLANDMSVITTASHDYATGWEDGVRAMNSELDALLREIRIDLRWVVEGLTDIKVAHALKATERKIIAALGDEALKP